MSPVTRPRGTGSPGSPGRWARPGFRRPFGSRRPSGRRWWYAVLAILASGLVLLPAGTAAAHPLGSFTVNTASVLRVQPGQVRVDIVVDMAEIPATQVKPEVDAAGSTQWRDRECGRLGEQARLTVDGRQSPLAMTASALAFPPGAGGLSTLRLVCRYATQTGSAATMGYELRAYTDRVGWREVVAVGDRATLVSTDVPARSPSGLLTSYPADPLTNPSDVTRASLTFRPGGPPAADPLAAEFGADGDGDSGGAVAGGSRPSSDGLTASFTGLVENESLSWGIAAVALVAAVALGAAHAFAPGHGKTVMAARIAGGSASGRQLAAMALAVTLAHTLGVFLLAVGLSASAGFAPEQIYPWLGVASGLLLLGLGVNLLRTRLGSLSLSGLRPPHPANDHTDDSHGDHSHGHHSRGDHSHAGADHSHGHHSHGHHSHAGADHSHVGDHAHGHHTDAHGTSPLGEHSHAHDGHAHDNHSHGDDRHRQVHSHDRPRALPVGHTHGGRWHSHSFGEKPPRLRDLLAVGFAGGMVPTPSAVVVLLGAVALGRAWFGLLLVLAYGAGMAATLVGIGFLLDRALHPLLRRVHAVSPNLAVLTLRWVPVVTAGVIVLVGAILVLRAGGQVAI